jgi:hypothetical protein
MDIFKHFNIIKGGEGSKIWIGFMQNIGGLNSDY